MKYICIAAAAMVGFAGAASAGGMGEPMMEPTPMSPPMAIDPSWTGFYAGGQIVTGDVENGGDDLDTDGLGVHAGYLYDLGSYVLGAEVDYDDLDVDLTDDASVLRLKGVAGYDVGRFMPYLTAGVAKVDIEIDGSDLNDTGSFYGLGATYAASDRVRISAEYLDHQFDDVESLGDVDASTASLRVSFSF